VQFSTSVAQGQTGHPGIHNQIAQALNDVEYVTLADNTVTTTELQDALTAAGSSGRMVKLPPGTHTLTGNVTIPSGCKGIIGNGATLSGGGIIFNTSTASFSYPIIRQLTITGATIGVQMTGTGYVQGLVTDNVHILNCSDSGVKVDCEIVEAAFYNTDVRQCNYGMFFTGSKVHNDLAFYKSSFQLNTSAGLYLDNSSLTGASGLVNLYGCIFQSNYGYGLRANRTQNLLLSGGYFESNNLGSVSASDVLLEGLSGFKTQYITLQNCRFSYNLSAPQQPQTFVRCDGEVRQLTLFACEFMNDARNGGGRLELDNNDVTLIASPILESLIIDPGTVTRV